MQALLSLAVAAAVMGSATPAPPPIPSAPVRPNTRPLDRSTPRAIVDASMRPGAKQERPPAEPQPKPRAVETANHRAAKTETPSPRTEPSPPPPAIAVATAPSDAEESASPTRCMTRGLRCRTVSTAGFAIGSFGLAAAVMGIALVATPDRVIPEEPVSLRSYEVPGIVTLALGGTALLTGIALVVTSHVLHRRAVKRGGSW